MNNPWKVATLGLVLTMVTALSTGLTTAYVMRPADGNDDAKADAPAASAMVSVPADTRPRVTAAPAVAARTVSAPATYPAVATPPAVTPVAADCATGGERAMRIAKPGLLGTLAGAGLGAIGGAIADGGSGAGKGALIGGIAGAAAGGGYGAYKTKQECGTIFGNADLPRF